MRYEQVQYWKTPFKWESQYAVDNKVIERMSFPLEMTAEIVVKELENKYPDACIVEME